MTLAVADSVHILTILFSLIRKGMSKHEAIAESLRINLQPVFLTSATTAIGFMTMNFSDAPPFRDLGNIVAMGVAAAFIYSVLFLPSLLAVLPIRIKEKTNNAVSARKPCDNLANFIINQRQFVFWSMLFVFVVLTAGILRIELNDDWIKYFSKRYDIRIASDFAEENLAGFNFIEYSLAAGETGGINKPEYLTKVDEFANWYRKQPKVVNVNTITDTFKRLNKNMHGDDKSWYRIPQQRDLAAQYLLLYEMSLPFGLDLNNQINVDKSATRMVVSLKGATTKELREEASDVLLQLKRMLPAEGYLTERMAQLRAKAHGIRNGHIARLEETRNVFAKQPTSAKKKAAAEMTAQYNQLVGIDTRLERLDKSAAEIELKIRELTSQAQRYTANYNHQKLCDCLKTAEKLQHHNSKLFKTIEHTESKLSAIAKKIATEVKQIEK